MAGSRNLCQDLSGASASKSGLEGERSGLWNEFARIIDEIRPRWVVVENVPGLLSINDGWDFGEVLRFLAQERYNAEWACIPASYMGAPHIRERVFIVAHSDAINGQERMGVLQELAPKIFRECPTERSKIWLQAPLESYIVDDGVSGRLYERIVGSLGNAVVPQAAEWIGRRIVEVEERYNG